MDIEFKEAVASVEVAESRCNTGKAQLSREGVAFKNRLLELSAIALTRAKSIPDPPVSVAV